MTLTQQYEQEIHITEHNENNNCIHSQSTYDSFNTRIVEVMQKIYNTEN